MQTLGGCCGHGVWPKFSAALRPEGGALEGGGHGDRTLRERDVREPAPYRAPASPRRVTPRLGSGVREVFGAVSPVGEAGVRGLSSWGGYGEATPPPLRVCSAGGTLRTLTPFCISRCPGAGCPVAAGLNSAPPGGRGELRGGRSN